MIVLGEFEPKSIFQHAKVMSQEIIHSKLEVIENAGHVPNLDQPDQFNKVKERFLRQLGDKRKINVKKWKTIFHI